MARTCAPFGRSPVGVVAIAGVAAWFAMSVPGGAQTVQGTDSASAHALYVQARAALPDREALHRLLDEAIAIDPHFAPAYALKAEHYAAAIAGTVARSNDSAAASELDRLAVHNAEKAIALDPSSSSAYSALALAHRQFWRWPQADAAYRRAYELNPDDAGIMLNYGWFNSFTRRHDEAIAIAARGVALHPTLANSHRDLGVAHAYAGNAEAAIKAMLDCVAIDPKITICHIYLAFALIRLDQPELAGEELALAEQLFGNAPTPATISSVAHGYFRAGRREDAARLFAELQTQAEDGVVGAGSWPLAYLAIGDEDQAFVWLERAIAKIENREPDEGFFNLMIIKANVAANPVLEQPRFRALRERIGVL
jgi:Flp pilus assembly protein TadD